MPKKEIDIDKERERIEGELKTIEFKLVSKAKLITKHKTEKRDMNRKQANLTAELEYLDKIEEG